ncbi:dUTP diphosphatase [Falsirhodobacter halotolerans]|uniref:dUTP diphosphatase n=1 Tax=Falsirhodobacter halotolerans TaxID=1146892 RepID=UPI001FD38631|nr:dUTP diphosphatase [Falsirhodobacter halotolerans]MCJ8138828.1 dUTP diphosphatase [Falsirhodobacter halotolerans]
MTDPTVEIRVLDPRVHDWGIPAYQTAGSAAVDLFACIDAPMEIAAGAPATLIPSGLALFMDTDRMAALVLPRSGSGHKKGLVLGNLVGLIDSDYTGEVKISLWNRNPTGAPIVVEPGERVAQMMFVPVLRPTLTVVDQFSGTTARGAGGFGSTG